MYINQELTNKLLQIIKDSQPKTSFSGNQVRYGEQTFTLPTPPSADINKTTLVYR